MSKDPVGPNTCLKCSGEGKLAFGDTCPHCKGSGQQEDNTGHPTAETPGAQPFDNVSGEPVNRLEVIDHTETGTGRDFVKWESFKFEVKLSYQDGGRTLKVFLMNSPEALPSNNASESNQLPSPSEQEDKPTKEIKLKLAHAILNGDIEKEKELLQQLSWQEAWEITKTRPADSKPEKLREILGLDHEPYVGVKHCSNCLAYNAIQALLATEYDRGKVDGALEEAKLVAKAGAYLKEHGPRNYALKRVVEIKGLKSKGESKE